MSAAKGKRAIPQGLKARVDAQRAEAVRLRAEGLTLVAIGERLGLANQRVGQLLKPVPPNHCRKCGGEIERQKRYHPQCLPSNRPPTSRTRAADKRVGPRKDLTGRRFGRWLVICEVGGRVWLCRCECGVERKVAAYSLRKKKSRGCIQCAGKDRRYVKPRRKASVAVPATPTEGEE